MSFSLTTILSSPGSRPGVRGHIPALDGIRAVAVLLVIIYHAEAPFFADGYLGVDMFFVLSGFLITSILLRDIEETGRIDLWRFYMRRLRRLMPALLCLVILYALLAPAVWPDISRYDHYRDALIAVFYLSDYSRAFWGIPDILRHSWSLSIEEHYYALWPFILLWVVRRYPGRKMIAVLGVSFFVATAWRYYLSIVGGQEWGAIYCRFDTRLSGLILGGFLAACVFYGSSIRQAKMLSAVLILTCFISMPLLNWENPLALTVGITLFELMTFFMIADVISAEPSLVRNILSSRPLVFLGQISYGLYLYHYPIVFYLRQEHKWYVTLPVGFAVALALSTASYYLVERRFLRGTRGLIPETKP
jgi:peptidoglycan/LPS O-acetylase OafA/YrhL